MIILDIFFLFLYKNIHCEYTFEVPHKKTYRRIIIKFSSLTRPLMLLAEKYADASILPIQTETVYIQTVLLWSIPVVLLRKHGNMRKHRP